MPREAASATRHGTELCVHDHSGELATKNEEERQSFLAGLRAHADRLLKFCHQAEQAGPAARAPDNFYNTEKHGLPSPGEIMFLGLLLLHDALAAGEARKLDSWCDSVLEVESNYLFEPAAWSVPGEWRSWSNKPDAYLLASVTRSKDGGRIERACHVLVPIPGEEGQPPRKRNDTFVIRYSVLAFSQDCRTWGNEKDDGYNE